MDDHLHNKNAMELVNRVSTFILVMGFALLGLFVLSAVAEDTQVILLFLGLLLVGIGIFINYRLPKVETPRVERFRLLKKKPAKPAAPHSNPPDTQPQTQPRRPDRSGKKKGTRTS